MSLLRDIQDAAIDNDTDITVVLRKCKVLATRLNNKEMDLWVEHELNGYNSPEEVPPYRVYKGVRSYGNFSGIGGSGMKNAPIPPSCLPENYREYIQTEYFMDPISYYVSLMKDEEASKSGFKSPWPADLVAQAGGKIIQYMNCFEAWKMIPAGVFAALLDKVRNLILSFVIEIEKEAPDAGEALPNTSMISEERVSQHFNNIIIGNVTTFTAGSQITTSFTEINVIQNDLVSLANFLKSIGMQQQDIEELKEAINKDNEDPKREGIGNNVKAWIGRMTEKAKSGVWNITKTLISNMLTQAIMKYYMGF
ncbi:hypothetical protein ACFLV0_04990 [Chloroflexota bacterium]